MTCPTQVGAAAANAQRWLSIPTLALTSSNLPLPRLWNRYFRPPFLAYSKLSGINARRGQMPQIDVFRIIAADEKIE